MFLLRLLESQSSCCQCAKAGNLLGQDAGHAALPQAHGRGQELPHVRTGKRLRLRAVPEGGSLLAASAPPQPVLPVLKQPLSIGGPTWDVRRIRTAAAGCDYASPKLR